MEVVGREAEGRKLRAHGHKAARQ